MARALFHELKPKDAGFELCGYGMDKNEFAFLVHRETKRVNEALIAMSLAKGERETHEIFDSLSRDTVIALCSRWARYLWAWKQLENDPHPHLWMPPDEKDTWRAILLAMTDDLPAASEARRQLWPEESQG